MGERPDGERAHDGAVPRIAAIGTALPGAPHDQRGIAERMIALQALDARGARRLRAFYRRTQIDTRHSVLAHDWTRATDAAFFKPGARPPTTAARMDLFVREAPVLALRAVHALLDASEHARGAKLDPLHVDHLIVVSCTGFFAPGLDVLLARELGLRGDVGRSLIGFQGCHAGLAALRLASDIATARPAASVLIVCVELSTVHFQHELTEANLLANALFADGAAAVLVEGAAVRRQSLRELRIESLETHLLPEGARDMRWDVGDEGFTLELSDRLPDLLRRHVPSLLRNAPALEAHDLSSATWAVHPGGAAILDMMARELGLAPDALAASREVLRRVGNLSSPTVFFVLEQILDARAAERASSDGTVIAIAFGPGLTVELVRLRPRTLLEDDETWMCGRTSRPAVTTRS